MKTPLICNKTDVSDAYLKRFFSWLTRIGAAPKFGSCNISHYQQRQCVALSWLEQSEAAGYPLRCRAGMIQYCCPIGVWLDLIRVHGLSADH